MVSVLNLSLIFCAFTINEEYKHLSLKLSIPTDANDVGNKVQLKRKQKRVACSQTLLQNESRVEKQCGTFNRPRSNLFSNKSGC